METILVNTADQFGWNTLTNQQLLSLITGDDTNAGILNEYLAECTPTIEGLMNLGIGIGEKTATKIKALHTLFTRTKPKTKYPYIKSSMDIYNAIRPNFDNVIGEVVWLMLIDGAGRLVKKIMISHGSFDCTLLDVRMVVKYALDANCSQVILAHNHPSGSVSPSIPDLKSTREIYQGCKLMRIHLIDHLIIAGDEYYSFADKEQFDYE